MPTRKVHERRCLCTAVSVAVTALAGRNGRLYRVCIVGHAISHCSKLLDIAEYSIVAPAERRLPSA